LNIQARNLAIVHNFSVRIAVVLIGLVMFNKTQRTCVDIL